MTSEMQWLNEPPAWRVHTNSLEALSAPNSDFWRKTHYGFTRDSGHFYYQEVQGNFSVEIRISGRYEALYDQAGLMLRVDEENWIKTGVEFFDGQQHASAVVTREFSDWSVVTLEGYPPCIWLRVMRKSEAVEIFYSLDGQKYSLLRLAYLVPATMTQVGPMCASPDGPGFTTKFEGFEVTLL